MMPAISELAVKTVSMVCSKTERDSPGGSKPSKCQCADPARDDNPSNSKDNNKSHASYWDVGVNPVLYRDGDDGIGMHADDDQGEKLILTVNVKSPKTTRHVVIRPKNFKNVENGDAQLELFLNAGDAYSMDGM